MQGRFTRVQVYLSSKYLLMLPCMFVSRGMSKDSTKKPGLEKLKVSNMLFSQFVFPSIFHLNCI